LGGVLVPHRGASQGPPVVPDSGCDPVWIPGTGGPVRDRHWTTGTCKIRVTILPPACPNRRSQRHLGPV